MGTHNLTTSAQWPAPAKLNLFLHVVGRRDDGYHLLQTVFQFIDRCDYLDFSLRTDGAIHRTGGIEGLAPDDDLVVQAARRLVEISAAPVPGVDIHIEKHIPEGGGLGGGSSDAATTLLALNRLWSLGLSNDVLAETGLMLGADVPIFIHGHAAFAEGVGERLTATNPTESWYLVLVPRCRVVTAGIFAHLQLTRYTPLITMADLSTGQLKNDCEAVVSRRYPAVAEAIAWLSRYGDARLTGTGACVFAPFDTEDAAQEVLKRLPNGQVGFVARGMNTSPVMRYL